MENKIYLQQIENDIAEMYLSIGEKQPFSFTTDLADEAFNFYHHGEPKPNETMDYFYAELLMKHFVETIKQDTQYNLYKNQTNELIDFVNDYKNAEKLISNQLYQNVNTLMNLPDNLELSHVNKIKSHYPNSYDLIEKAVKAATDKLFNEENNQISKYLDENVKIKVTPLTSNEINIEAHIDNVRLNRHVVYQQLGKQFKNEIMDNTLNEIDNILKNEIGLNEVEMTNLKKPNFVSTLDELRNSMDYSQFPTKDNIVTYVQELEKELNGLFPNYTNVVVLRDAMKSIDENQFKTMEGAYLNALFNHFVDRKLDSLPLDNLDKLGVPSLSSMIVENLINDAHQEDVYEGIEHLEMINKIFDKFGYKTSDILKPIVSDFVRDHYHEISENFKNNVEIKIDENNLKESVFAIHNHHEDLTLLNSFEIEHLINKEFEYGEVGEQLKEKLENSTKLKDIVNQIDNGSYEILQKQSMNEIVNKILNSQEFQHNQMILEENFEPYRNKVNEIKSDFFALCKQKGIECFVDGDFNGERMVKTFNFGLNQEMDKQFQEKSINGKGFYFSIEDDQLSAFLLVSDKAFEAINNLNNDPNVEINQTNDLENENAIKIEKPKHKI